jgi:glycosyltransferase involved in cell wall biosynthesis
MSEYWREQIVRELHIPSNRIQALPAGFNTSVNPEKVDAMWVRKQFDLNDHPTVFYMGTITPPRDMSILADMMACVVRQIPKARLLLLYGHGEEARVPILKQEFLEKGIEKNVVFAPPVPYHRVPEYVKAAHVGLSPIETIPLYNVSSPYKFAEMLGMACPVVASDTPEQSYVLNKSGGGICVPYNADAFAEAVVHILTHPDKARTMSAGGRAFIEEERSYDVLAGRVEEVLKSLVTA